MIRLKLFGTRSYSINPRRNASQRPSLEPLEGRQLLSTCHVTRLGDFGAGADLGGGQSRGDLRYCITHMNANPGADNIDFSVTGTINLTGPLPNLADDVIITAPGSDQVTIRRDTGGDYRIFTVNADVTAQLFGMTITNGHAVGSVLGDASKGGGILNYGTLILLGDVAVVQNKAQSDGGGIYSYGDFTAYFSTIANNGAGLSSCGSVGGSGGGLYSRSGMTVIHHSTVAENDACRDGGGIHNRGSLTLSDVTVTSNTSDIGRGGGIYNQSVMDINAGSVVSNNVAKDNDGGGISSVGSLTIRDTMITNNEAMHMGGATTATGGGIDAQGVVQIYNSAITYNSARAGTYGYGGGINFQSGSLTLTNSTVAHNLAVSASLDDNFAFGGGIAQQGLGSVSISYSTIAHNACIGDQWHDEYGGGLYQAPGGSPIELYHTIVAHNVANWGGDVYGELNSSGYNLISSSSGGSGYALTDILDVDPLLGPLQDNGGPTQTMALLPGSPAIDAGDNADAPEWDQRGPGFPRIVNGRIDIGAFEVQATGAPSFPNVASLITADFEITKPKRRK